MIDVEGGLSTPIQTTGIAARDLYTKEYALTMVRVEALQGLLDIAEESRRFLKRAGFDIKNDSILRETAYDLRKANCTAPEGGNKSGKEGKEERRN